jgi:hypothetical protein
MRSDRDQGARRRPQHGVDDLGASLPGSEHHDPRGAIRLRAQPTVGSGAELVAHVSHQHQGHRHGTDGGAQRDQSRDQDLDDAQADRHHRRHLGEHVKLLEASPTPSPVVQPHRRPDGELQSGREHGHHREGLGPDVADVVVANPYADGERCGPGRSVRE